MSNKANDAKHTLEEMQNARHSAEEMKKELFEHNPLLHGQDNATEEPAQEQDSPEEESADDSVIYIKRAEDRERIARNSGRNTAAHAPSPDFTAIFQSNMNQLLELQMQAMDLMIGNMGKWLQMGLMAPAFEPRRDRVA